jgi:hypothetical protein
MTATTHSPWATPAGAPKNFSAAELNAFAYLDASIERFFERLQKAPTIWEETLIVIAGDHTSVTFGKEFAERLRVPLIIHSPKVRGAQDFGAKWASQVDILPTILGHFEGDHWYAGMGRNLLDVSLKAGGIVGGTTRLGYYLKDDYLLEYDPAGDEMRMFALPAAAARQDISAEHSREFTRLRREYFAHIELAKRLSAGQQIFPWSVDMLSDGKSPAVTGTVEVDGKQRASRH